MKKNTFRLVFLCILILLISATLLLQNFIRSFLNQTPEKPFKNVDKQKINEILIQDGKNKTTIFRDKNKWVLQKEGIAYQADQDRIDTIINGFIDLTKGEIVSNNRNKQEGLGIGGKKIELKSANKTYLLYIGNVSDVTKNYVRINNDNKVFAASGFNDVFSNEDYRDLFVHFIDNEDQINQITIVFDNQESNFIKKNNEWYSGETKLKKERVDFFLSDLKTLKASDILKEGPSFIRSDLTINIKEGNLEKSAEFLQKDSSNYILKTSVSNQLFQIADVYVSSLKKQGKDFTE